MKPEGMPALYLAAMQHGFQRYLDAENKEESMEQFLALGNRIAQSYAGFNASTPAMVHIVQGGITYAMQVSDVSNKPAILVC